MRARVRAGDPDAFSELFEEHVRSVDNHAFRLTADWSTAEDIVSLTFLEAWRVRGRVDAGRRGAVAAAMAARHRHQRRPERTPCRPAL